MFLFDPRYVDPLYWVITLLAGGVSVLASWWVQSAFSKYRKIPNQRGLTGAQAAREMLSREGLGDVSVERVAGTLSDHYDPSARVIRLSSDIHDGQSLAAISVACHEAGHALQHAQGYAPMRLRSLSVPLASIGGGLGPMLCVAGILLGAGEQAAEGTGLGLWLAKAGLLLFAGAAFFQVVTLPVELNASSRAKAAMTADGLVVDREEASGAAAMLRAAAFTYVAAVASTMLQMLYFAIRAGLIRNRRRDG